MLSLKLHIERTPGQRQRTARVPHLLRHLRLLVYPMMLAFCWQSLGFNNYLYAFESKPPVVAPDGVAEWRAVNAASDALVDVLEAMQRALEIGASHRRLVTTLRARMLDFEEAREQLRRYQEQARTLLELRGGGPETLARQDEAADEFRRQTDAVLAEVQRLIDTRDTAPALTLVKSLLRMLPRPVPRADAEFFDPDRLPYRNPRPATAEEPEAGAEPLLRTFSLAPAMAPAANGLPVPEDTAEDGVEIRFEPAITALAAELDHDPVRIYEYVRNEIDFEPTYGSIKGAPGTLAAGSGNAFDQASLLIALLRASGIPARYQVGTLEISPEQAANWVGVENPRSASTLMSSGGIPAVAVLDSGSGELLHVRVEHTWVLAYVDYTPSRGAVFQDGDRWIRLDPAFKQYEMTPGYDFDAQLLPGAENLRDQIQASATTNPYGVTGLNTALLQSSVSDAAAVLRDHVTDNPPEVMEELIGQKRRIQKVYGLLPPTGAYTVTGTPLEYAQVPANKRHSVTFRLSRIEEGLLGQERYLDFTRTLSMPQLASKRITLAYGPADDATANYLQSLLPGDPGTVEEVIAATPKSLSAPSVRLKPQLRIDGQTLVEGSTVGLGYDQAFEMIFSSPGGYANGVADNEITAGSTNAIVLDLGPLGNDFIAQRREALRELAARIKYSTIPAEGISTDAVYGESLHLAGLRYWQQVRLMEGIAQRQLGVTATAMPRAGIFSHNLNVVESCFGFFCTPTPQVASSGGLGTDIDHNLVAVVANTEDGTPAANKKSVDYMLMTGLAGSYLEGNIHTQGFATHDGSGTGSYAPGGISTAHILGYANAQGMPVYTVDSTNLASVLPLLAHDASVKTAVQAGVGSGKTVLIPQAKMDLGWWQGTGYAVIDPNTGAGAYMISGGYAGGGEDMPTLDPMTSFLIGALLLAIGIFAGPILGVILALIGIAMALYDLYANIHNIQNNPNIPDDAKEMMIGLYVALALIGVILAVGGVFFGALGAFVAIALYMLYITVMVSIILNGMIGLLSRRNEQLDEILNGVDARDPMHWWHPGTMLAGAALWARGAPWSGSGAVHVAAA